MIQTVFTLISMKKINHPEQYSICSLSIQEGESRDEALCFLKQTRYTSDKLKWNHEFSMPQYYYLLKQIIKLFINCC